MTHRWVLAERLPRNARTPPRIEERLIKGLGLQGLRVAYPEPEGAEKLIRTVALCPGAGGPFFKVCTQETFFLPVKCDTMTCWPRVAQGSAVLLTEHSNSERVFERVRGQASGRTEHEAFVSKQDRDPLVPERNEVRRFG